MVRICSWNTDRTVEIWQWIIHCLGFGFLDAPFDFTHGIEIFGDFCAVCWPKLLSKSIDVFTDPVE